MKICKEKNKNIPIFVSHLGCPNDCIFCNQKKINGMSYELEFLECQKIIEDALWHENSENFANKDTNIEIAFFGGSFTGIEASRQERYLKIAKSYIESGKVKGIRLSTRPDYIDEKILKRLAQYGVTTIELGVQSMDDEVLLLNNRKISANRVVEAVSLIRKFNFQLGLQMMTNMYGSNDEKDLLSAQKIKNMKPDFVRIYPTVVVCETKLYDYYKAGVYQTKSLDESIELCSKVYKIFVENAIPVIRIGLMASDEIKSNKVIGAYHEAYGELVIGEYYYKKMVGMIERNSAFAHTLIITAPKDLVSKIVGNKKKNTIRLMKRFNFKNIKVIESVSSQLGSLDAIGTDFVKINIS